MALSAGVLSTAFLPAASATTPEDITLAKIQTQLQQLHDSLTPTQLQYVRDAEAKAEDSSTDWTEIVYGSDNPSGVKSLGSI